MMNETNNVEKDHPQESEDNEEAQTKNYEDNLKRFRELLMQENINIVAKLKRYKATDFRRKIVLNQLKELRKLSELSKIWISVPFVEQSFSHPVITVDSSKAGSNIDSLRLAINDLGWKEFPNGRSSKCCHVVWNSCGFNDNKAVFGAFVNKFPGISQCLHKVGFSRILETMRMLFPDQYNFYPLTWYLPHQISDFTIYCKTQELENKKEKYYIVKPDTGTQGEGIYLIRKPQDYKISSRNHVVQEYLATPLLLDGYKFDLRIYVVLLSLDPLKVYLCNEGLARFCTQKYCLPTITNHGNSFMHLTNYSLNKRSNQFIHTQNVDTGSKRTMSSVLAALEANGCDVSKIWQRLEELVYKTMLAIVPQLKVHYVTEVLVKSEGFSTKQDTSSMEGRPNCFQILGFDVLIMEDLQPLLLEVNSNPSLRLDCEMEIAPGICEYYLSKVDVRIKKPLVKNTLQLLEQEIAQKFNIEMKSREEGNWISRANEIFPLALEESEFVDTSDKENVEDIEKEWSIDSDYGPYFVEIAKKNNTLPKGFQLSRSNSLNNILDPKNAVITCTNADVQVSVIGTSPHIRKIQLQREHERLAKEKSWLNIPENEDCEKENARLESSSTDSKPKCFLRSDLEIEDCCLNLISSKCYKSIYDKLRILEETTIIFFHAMGHRYSENMGATAFRTFGRHCQLHQLGFNHAMIDLIYIEIQRRWSYLSNYETKGLCYQGFLEAFFRIAFARYTDQSKRGAVQSLIDHCKRSIGPENFNWTKTLYPSSDTPLPDKHEISKDSKTSSTNKERTSKQIFESNSIRSSWSESNEPNTVSKPLIHKPSKYELIKAIQNIYRRKLRIPKPSELEDDLNSEAESVKSLPSINDTKQKGKPSYNTSSKQLSSYRESNSTKLETISNNRATLFKTYRYETPLTNSIKREDSLNRFNFVNNRKPQKANSLLLDRNRKSDFKATQNMKETLEKVDSIPTINYLKSQRYTSHVAETTHAVNIKNNMKLLSPINNERMMKIISVYGGNEILKTSLNGLRKRYNVLKPI